MGGPDLQGSYAKLKAFDVPAADVNPHYQFGRSSLCSDNSDILIAWLEGQAQSRHSLTNG
jgi:hypothetical protein